MNATLYHFTCDHGRVGIERDGYLKPHAHPFLPELGPIVWLTDLAAPDPPSVGLTSTWLPCDRLEHRYEVARGAVPGLIWWPFVRGRCAWSIVADLERFGQPTHWWLTGERVSVAREEAL